MTKALFIGRTTLDLIFKMDKIPKSNTKMKSKEFTQAGGGPALNAAVVFSKLNKGNTDLFTVIGSSPMTELVLDDLKKNNVNYYDFNKKEENLATSSILIEPNGNRTIVGSPLKEIKVANNREIDWGKEYDIVLWDGYYPEILDMYLQKKKNNPIIVLDADRYQDHVEKYFDKIDILIAGDTFKIPRKNLNKFLKRKFKTFALTNGSKEIFFYENDSFGEIPVDKIEAVDTLGAGDFFHGSFCYYYMKNKNFKNALKEASKIAGLSCQYFGSRKWLDKIKIK